MLGLLRAAFLPPLHIPTGAFRKFLDCRHLKRYPFGCRCFFPGWQYLSSPIKWRTVQDLPPVTARSWWKILLPPPTAVQMTVPHRLREESIPTRIPVRTLVPLIRILAMIVPTPAPHRFLEVPMAALVSARMSALPSPAMTVRITAAPRYQEGAFTSQSACQNDCPVPTYSCSNACASPVAGGIYTNENACQNDCPAYPNTGYDCSNACAPHRFLEVPMAALVSARE